MSVVVNASECFFNMSICKLNAQVDSRKRQREVCHKQRHINGNEGTAEEERKERERERGEKESRNHTQCTSALNIVPTEIRSLKWGRIK